MTIKINFNVYFKTTEHVWTKTRQDDYILTKQVGIFEEQITSEHNLNLIPEYNFQNNIK